MPTEKEIGRHVFVLNQKDSGGEQLVLVTKIIDNGDPNPITEQEFSLQSYCNCASFTLIGAQFTVENLRRLANELESELIKARSKIN